MRAFFDEPATHSGKNSLYVKKQAFLLPAFILFSFVHLFFTENRPV